MSTAVSNVSISLKLRSLRRESIPVIRLAVEVHGRQHYEHIPFFHETKKDFVLAKARDEDKVDWCELNNIELITLKYSETDDEWRKQLKRF